MAQETYYYPIYLDLKDQPCLVVGGGLVGARKARDLLNAGARVTLIALTIVTEIKEFQLKYPENFTLQERAYQEEDLVDLVKFFLVYAATNDLKMNQLISSRARENRQLVNSAAEPNEGNFIVPAKIERGPVQISVTTSGLSPTLTRQIQRDIAKVLDPELADLARLLGELRPLVLATISAEETKQAYWQELCENVILREYLRKKDLSGAQKFARQLLEKRSANFELS